MNINLKEDVKPISYIKSNAAKMMKYVNERKSPIIVTQNGEAKAVLMDIESYQQTENAFALLKLLQYAEKSIAEGNVYDHEQVFSELRKKISKK